MNLVVLSPHLDDAVLSVGARIAAAARRGDRVRVLTVLAGDPETPVAAGPWDTESGFRTAGEAARVRREEDARACAVLGAEASWLPYADEQYPRGGDDDEIWGATTTALAGADEVLAPGFPLAHTDHRWLAGLVLSHRNEMPRLGLYTEQPYAVGKGQPRDRIGILTEHGVPEPAFEASADAAAGRRLRRRARRHYRSQLEQLARYGEGTWRHLEREMARWERRHGIEPVAWIPPEDRA